MKKAATILISISLLLLGVCCRAAILQSPDGQITLDFGVRDTSKCSGCPMYRITYDGKTVIAPSRMGFDIKGNSPLDKDFSIDSEESGSHDSTWSPVFGERSSIRDNYNFYKVKLKKNGDTDYSLEIEFRAYDAGVAFRYTINIEAINIEIKTENTEFRFSDDYISWQVTSAQGVYEKKPLSRMYVDTERPLTIKIDENLYAAIAEAALVDFSRMRLKAKNSKPIAVTAALAGPVTGALPITTPWRVISIAGSPARLLENNDIILNLNESCAIKDTSWIKPGKVIREVTLTTDGGMATVDFAAKHNIKYVLFDAGWYGPENNDASDATTVTVDPARSAGPLDLKAVIAHAKEKGVGIILYVNHRALEKQLDEILPLYKSWGVAGIKFGFVNVGPQEWTSWLHNAVRRAAEYDLMVDIHDEYRPTGYSRTYPNLVTQEGIGGDETSPTNEQTLNILFTRMLAGAADNTVCYFDSRVTKNATHASQLAKAVILYSPFQVLYWYDRPADAPRKAGGAGGEFNVISETPELEFYDALPTTWDDSKVLYGNIGKYAAIARRSGKEWYIGAMTAGEARTFQIPLYFLTPGVKYTASIYEHDPGTPTPTHIKITHIQVDASASLSISVGANSGAAIRITPD